MSKTLAKALAFGAIVLFTAIGGWIGFLMPKAVPAFAIATLVVAFLLAYARADFVGAGAVVCTALAAGFVSLTFIAPSVIGVVTVAMAAVVFAALAIALANIDAEDYYYVRKGE